MILAKVLLECPHFQALKSKNEFVTTSIQCIQALVDKYFTENPIESDSDKKFFAEQSEREATVTAPVSEEELT